VTRVLIADDSEITRAQLSAIITRREGWTVCGESRNGLKAVLLAQELKPDLVILDLVMPMLDGLRAAAEIAKILPTVPIVIYSVEILTELELEAKKYGVWALVSKSAGENTLIETLDRLLAASQPQVLVGGLTAGSEIRLPPTDQVELGDDSTPDTGDKSN
jgi:DNA-binding NarL/FixJ family response regulator